MQPYLKIEKIDLTNYANPTSNGDDSKINELIDSFNTQKDSKNL